MILYSEVGTSELIRCTKPAHHSCTLAVGHQRDAGTKLPIPCSADDCVFLIRVPGWIAGKWLSGFTNSRRTYHNRLSSSKHVDQATLSIVEL